MNGSIVIAVDGTAASGKGTLAKQLAQHFGFAHLDSGSLYRLTALALLDSRGDPTSESDAVKGARSIDLSRAGDPAIRTDVVGRAASQVAAIPAVRKALFAFQRAFLEHPPGGSEGAVMDGRDIGTVICEALCRRAAGSSRPPPLSRAQKPRN
jgi:cytidylate kinase